MHGAFFPCCFSSITYGDLLQNDSQSCIRYTLLFTQDWDGAGTNAVMRSDTNAWAAVSRLSTLIFRFACDYLVFLQLALDPDRGCWAERWISSALQARQRQVEEEEDAEVLTNKYKSTETHMGHVRVIHWSCSGLVSTSQKRMGGRWRGDSILCTFHVWIRQVTRKKPGKKWTKTIRCQTNVCAMRDAPC